ncbi:MAG: OB-fold domain-containing protein [Chloroflexi bacterium]|nr:OB-fold domain-containing protein [Chloroflexota bacterium]
MTEKRQILVGEGLFTWPSDKPKLIATHCKSCGDYFFPKSFTCHNPKCKEKQVEEVTLSQRGKLWSYSVLYYPPPPPFVPRDPFEPIPIAEVEIPEGLKIIGMMEGIKPKDIKIGMTLELTVGTLYTDKNGNDVIGWKFTPVKA